MPAPPGRWSVPASANDARCSRSASARPSPRLPPENLLDAYAEWLAAPEQRLYLKPTEVTVDRMGVISPTAAAGVGYSTLNFPELVARDRRQWIVLVARISRQDAQDALARQEQANRYLLI
jgi:hypothetical protein